MSAFQAYTGAYEINGDAFNWRCYATARVYDIRRTEHGPFPEAPTGRKWISPLQQDHKQVVGCLVDATVEDFSQILLQVQSQPGQGLRLRDREALAAAMDSLKNQAAAPQHEDVAA